MDNIRSFIAIELTNDIKDKISKIQEQLKDIKAKVRWVKPDSIHLTLKFLGNINFTQIEDIEFLTGDVIKDFKPWEINIKGLGVFPNFAYPRVIWVGVEDKNKFIVKLAEKTEEELEKLGFKKEKRTYNPHLTLGRIKNLFERKNLTQFILDREEHFLGTMKIDRVFLFKSQLTPSGAIYTKLKEFLL
jgi:2'-5' RNA ligase